MRDINTGGPETIKLKRLNHVILSALISSSDRPKDYQTDSSFHFVSTSHITSISQLYINSTPIKEMGQERQRKVLIVGGGPVGALTALSLFRRGWSVELWESRKDPRGKDEKITNLRSINLAISSRGLEALRSVDPSLGMLHDRYMTYT